MTTTSIWRVKGWLGKKEGMTSRQTQSLADAIKYAGNVEKTQVTDDE